MAGEEQTVLVRCADLAKFAVPASVARRAGASRRRWRRGESVVELPRGSSAGPSPRRSRTTRPAPTAEYGEFVRGLTHDAAIDLIYAAHHLGDEALFNLFAGYRAN
uniref:Uncharacterized protein n=1 Tax=Aegilops tauschii TaxID=37682 RepID=M8BSH1_AEGTA